MSLLIPDVIEPIEAWRAWNYWGRRLHSPIASGLWEPGVVFEARCLPRDIYSPYPDSTELAEPPHENCTCGVYALYEPGELPNGDLYGKVKLWGRVIRGTKGVRGQYAYPSELYVPAWMQGEIALRDYRVPVLVGDTKTPLEFPPLPTSPAKLHVIDGSALSHPNNDPLPQIQSPSTRLLGQRLSALDQCARRTLELRYGLTGDPPMTLEEVGRMLGVTRQRVRAIENHALHLLRQPPPSVPAA